MLKVLKPKLDGEPLYKEHNGSNPSLNISLPNLRETLERLILPFCEILTLGSSFWWFKLRRGKEEVVKEGLGKLELIDLE